MYFSFQFLIIKKNKHSEMSYHKNRAPQSHRAAIVNRRDYSHLPELYEILTSEFWRSLAWSRTE